MKKLIIASVSGIALMGLAACSDTDGTTTQAVPDGGDPAIQQEQDTIQPAEPADPLADPAPMQ